MREKQKLTKSRPEEEKKKKRNSSLVSYFFLSLSLYSFAMLHRPSFIQFLSSLISFVLLSRASFILFLPASISSFVPLYYLSFLFLASLPPLSPPPPHPSVLGTQRRLCTREISEIPISSASPLI